MTDTLSVGARGHKRPGVGDNQHIEGQNGPTSVLADAGWPARTKMRPPRATRRTGSKTKANATINFSPAAVAPRGALTGRPA
eukprot:4033692-Lingulodinium_polyedra.AAC.1